ncbi:MAG: hypothetical protein FIB01_13805 [Gemmatimonadetes bacterium]|nr:hypothetical protein [Gemmatimonadota bacterium]
MTRSACAALLLLVSLAAPAAAQQKRLFFTSRTDPKASGEVRTLDAALENQLGMALMEKYPCMEQASTEMVSEMLSVEKMKQILGAGDDNALAQMGGSIGADHLAVTQVTQVGTGYNVQITILNTRTAHATFKQSTQLSGAHALDDAVAAAKRAAQGMTFPACPATDWSGTVVLVEQYSGSAPSEDKKTTISGNMSLTMNCRLDGMNGSEAKCSVSYNSVMNVSDGSHIKQTAQDNITCNIGIDSDASGTRLVVGSIRLKTNQSGKLVLKDDQGKGETVVTNGPNEQQLGGWEFHGPPPAAGAKSVSGSGTWGNAKATWTLKPPAGQ